MGIGKIHLVCALTHGNLDYQAYGFDVGVEFPPHHPTVPNMSHKIDFYRDFRGAVFDYADVANLYLVRQYPGSNVYRAVFPAWDNTARVNERALVVLNGTPENYEYWLSSAVSRTRADFPKKERMVFINAWNEWAEGCHLEPERKYGHAYLEATKRVAEGSSTKHTFTHIGKHRNKQYFIKPVPRAPEATAVAELSAATIRADPFAPTPVYERSMANKVAIKARRGLGLLLRPFPGLRQRAVNLFLRVFDDRK